MCYVFKGVLEALKLKTNATLEYTYVHTFFLAMRGNSCVVIVKIILIPSM